MTHGMCRVYVLVILCMNIYQTMDGVDGKVARNTKSGSSLGHAHTPSRLSHLHVFSASFSAHELEFAFRPSILLAL